MLAEQIWAFREARMLTERRKEFLEAVVRCYNARGEPVHYTDVAEVMGVSKWTAYDILTILAQDGYLEVVRRVERRNNSPGRSQVLFRPTVKTYSFVKAPAPQRFPDGIDWEKAQKELLKRLSEADQKGLSNILKETLAELPQTSNPLLFCAKLIVALLLAVWTVRRTAQVLVFLKEALSSLSTPETALILLAGLALGLVLRSGRSKSQHTSLSEHIPRYVHQVKTMDKKQQESLLLFAREATRRLSLAFQGEGA